MKHILKVLIATFASLFIFANLASAHVTVQPSSSAPEAWETYTLKVPVEKDVATTKVILKVPAGVEFVSYQPVPGWKVATEKGKDGKVVTVTWEATAEGISSGQFQQFVFVAKNPEKETSIAWDAFQYYKDGEIVEWSGEEGSDTPHSVTAITATPATNVESTDHHSHDQHSTDHVKATAGVENNDGNQTVSITLASIALILAIVALIFAIRKSKR